MENQTPNQTGRSAALPALGIALAAGAAGTAAMTLSMALDQRMRGTRRPRTAASVAETATGMDAAATAGDRQTLSSGLHWLYGTGLGTALVPLEGVSEPLRTVTFLGGVYGTGLALEQLAGRRDAPSQQDETAFGANFVHHLVYAGVASMAYNGLQSLAAGRAAPRADRAFGRFGRSAPDAAMAARDDAAVDAATAGAGSTAGARSVDVPVAAS